MTIRTYCRIPSRHLGAEPVRRDLPAAAYAGPAAVNTHDKRMADALGQIAVTFSGALHLASVQLPNGRWLSVTTA